MGRRIRYLVIAVTIVGACALIGLEAARHANSSGDARQALPPVHVSQLPPPVAAVPPKAPPVPTPEPPAWVRNAVSIAVPPGRNLIAIVIDDMGVDRVRSDRATALPAPLTLAFLPYARQFEVQIATARARGHETLVHVPMQPVGTEDPGPGALTLALEPVEIRTRLAASLDRAGPVVGINNHMGSRFTVDRDAMRPVLEELKARGLLFLDSLTSGASVGPAVAREMGVPYAMRDIFLDNDPRAASVRARLAEVERVANRQGHAVAIGHPHDGTLAALAAWLPDVRERGFVLVPVSAIVSLSRGRERS